jgi:cytochrome c oxidase subunit II
LRFTILAAGLVLLAVSGSAQDAASGKKSPAAPVILHMTAKDFEFDPPEIHVRQGAPIELHVVSTDRTHGIHIDPFPDARKPNTPPGLSFVNGEDCYKLKKDEDVIVLFTGMDVGTYSFKCCKQCGTGHKKMVGKIVVDPVD